MILRSDRRSRPFFRRIPRRDHVDRRQQFIGGGWIEILGRLHRPDGDPVKRRQLPVILLPSGVAGAGGGRLHPLRQEVPGDGVLEFAAVLLLDHRPTSDGVQIRTVARHGDILGQGHDLSGRLLHGHRVESHPLDLGMVVIDPTGNLAVGRQRNRNRGASGLDDASDVRSGRIQYVDGQQAPGDGADGDAGESGVLHDQDL